MGGVDNPAVPRRQHPTTFLLLAAGDDPRNDLSELAFSATPPTP